MRLTQHSAAAAIATLVALLATPHVIEAQTLSSSRLGLSEVARAGVAAASRPNIGDSVHSHGHWQTGALIGGLIGAALAVTYNSVVYDSEHKSLRVLEFTFGSAIIGGLITAK